MGNIAPNNRILKRSRVAGAVCVHLVLLAACNQNTSVPVATNAPVFAPIPADSELDAASQILAHSLRKLNLTNPLADLDSDMQRGNPGFIGINGYSCFAPGIDNFGGTSGDQKLASSFPLHCIDGTGDVLSGQLLPLQKVAEDYAFTYNRELLRRIRAGRVKLPLQ
jgi:hypothetical protein